MHNRVEEVLPDLIQYATGIWHPIDSMTIKHIFSSIFLKDQLNATTGSNLSLHYPFEHFSGKAFGACALVLTRREQKRAKFSFRNHQNGR